MNRLAFLTRSGDIDAAFVASHFRAALRRSNPSCAEAHPRADASTVEPLFPSQDVAPVSASASASDAVKRRDAHLCVEGCGGVAVAFGRCGPCDLATVGEQS